MKTSHYIFPYITKGEWACPHCGVYPTLTLSTYELFERFKKIREEFGAPIKITSGWRCETYQKYLFVEDKSSALISPHEFAIAMDLDSDNNEKLYEIILSVDSSLRIGYNKYMKRFIHIDMAYEIPNWLIDFFVKTKNYNPQILKNIYENWIKGKQW